MKFTQTQIDRFRRVKQLEQIQMLDPVEFETFVGWLYYRDGFTVRSTSTSGDQGIDLRLKKGKKRLIVQCKRYSGTVGQPTVRDLYGALHHTGADGADLVTSGRISQQAESWAAGKPIRLIDGYDLVAWVNKNRRSRIAKEKRSSRWLVMGGALLIALVIAIGAVAGALWVLNQRVERSPAPVLIIPTPRSTELPESAGENPPAVGQPVATATLPGSQPNPGDSEVTAVRMVSRPTIDGILDEWRDIDSFAAPYRVYAVSNWDGSDDLAAAWRLSWDEDALYFAVQITDDRHVQTQTGADTFKGDSVDIQLDTDRPGDFAAAVSPDDFQLAFSPGNFAELPAEAFRFQGNNSGQMVASPGHSLRVAAQSLDDGYVLEGAIPWSDIGVSPTPGLKMGANFNATDNDSTGVAVQEVMISNVASRTFRNPTTWGIVVLEGESEN